MMLCMAVFGVFYKHAKENSFSLHKLLVNV